ncbi:MAG: sugar porter family MFS transporter [Acidobacteriaceae bacterium]
MAELNMASPISENPTEEADIRTAYMWAIASIAALGGLLFGYDWVVIGGAKPFYEAYFHLDSSQLIGWANSCALLGCLAGSFLAGVVNEKYGRKHILLATGILFAVSSVCTGWAAGFTTFVAWRIVGGVAIGLASNISPTYIAEIAPAKWRGRLVSLNQLAIVCGIMAAQVVNWSIAEKVPEHATTAYIAGSWNGLYGWRWMFTAVALPAVVLVACSLFIPESPRWLASKARNEEAFQVLADIGGEQYARQELLGIQDSLRTDAERRISRQDLLTPNLRFVLAIGVGLAVLQQWSGINILFNYAEEVYKSAGYGVNGVLLNVLVTGVVNLVFTLLSMALVDRFGRRPLLLVGCCGIGISNLLAAYAYRAHLSGGLVLALTLCAIAFYAVSLAPVTWVVISEIFPNRLRSVGVSTAVASLWAASFLLTYSFPSLVNLTSMSGTFLLYGAFCLLGGLLVYRFVPETKGKSLEELEIALKTHS